MMKDFVDKIKAKQDLSFDESKAAFEILMEGKSTRITGLPDNLSRYLCGTLNMPATFFLRCARLSPA